MVFKIAFLFFILLESQVILAKCCSEFKLILLLEQVLCMHPFFEILISIMFLHVDPFSYF